MDEQYLMRRGRDPADGPSAGTRSNHATRPPVGGGSSRSRRTPIGTWLVAQLAMASTYGRRTIRAMTHPIRPTETTHGIASSSVIRQPEPPSCGLHVPPCTASNSTPTAGATNAPSTSSARMRFRTDRQRIAQGRPCRAGRRAACRLLELRRTPAGGDPVRAGLCAAMASWLWSTAGAVAGRTAN